MGEQQARELLAFLRPESRLELRGRAARAALELTGDPAGRRLLSGRPELVAALLAATGDACGAVAGDACRALVNLAAEPEAHGALEPALPALLPRALDAEDPLAALAAAALANLSREEVPCRRLLRALGGPAPLLEAFCAREALHHLGPLLANLSQLPPARAFLLDRDRCVLPRLLPYTQYAGSALRRGGVVGTLRNCCFDYGHHEWLLSDEVDILPFLLLPLAGPEEFPEEEMEKLPLDLQYLSPEKQREPDPDIRKMLLEALLLRMLGSRPCSVRQPLWVTRSSAAELTATKLGRQLVRERGTYFILRELHKWERDPSVLAACEKLIQVLIGDEPEPGMENLLEVEIPAEVEEQLQRLDREEERHERTAPGSQAPQG